MDQSQHREQEDTAVSHCHWHPEVETRLSCSRCEKNICTQCMVQAAVGIHCRECGRAVKMPTFDVKPSYYARALAVGAAIAIGGGLLWTIFTIIFGDFLSSVAAIGVGYAAGELISLAVNRKRGAGLAWIAGGSVVVAFLISWLLADPLYGIFGLLFVGVGVYTAVERVR